ncbi:MAG: hypothetical protein HGA22_10140, partial [Clostridiales bacterium]|nr:hypothetical protein [Clostridiales bacterium]
MKIKLTGRTLALFISLAMLCTLLAGGMTASAASYENYVISNGGPEIETTTTYTGTATSYNRRSDDFSVGYYVENGVIRDDYSLLADADTPVSELDLNLKVFGEGFTPVITTGAATILKITGSIDTIDDSQGENASDFNGLGTMIVAAGRSTVNADKLRIYTEGFLRDAFISDTHAKLTITDSDITTMGANPLTEAYDGYVNSAIQNIMLSPPWVLGIQGGVRSANMLGEKPTMSVIDSRVTGGGWGILSVDASSSAMMNVLDSDLRMLPESQGGMSSGNFSYSSRFGSGYGSYIIGGANENYYGADISGTTYAAILTGGNAWYRSSKGDVTLYDADGGTLGIYQGKGRPTTIDSVFGFMAHNSGSINVLDGTIVKSQGATFLYKAANVTFSADEAILKPESGIILQMIDNDDSTVGASMGQGGPVFNTTFYEDAGWPSENGNVTATLPDDNAVNQGPFGPPTVGPNYGKVYLNLTNGKYAGDVFNGTGYYNQVADSLFVNIGEDASLRGTIARTETIHVDENGDQNTEFTINEYYYLGQVANRPYNDSNNSIAVSLADGAKWTVTDTSYITGLTLGAGSMVKAPFGFKVQMSINGAPPIAIEENTSYSGKIIISLIPYEELDEVLDGIDTGLEELGDLFEDIMEGTEDLLEPETGDAAEGTTGEGTADEGNEPAVNDDNGDTGDTGDSGATGILEDVLIKLGDFFKA